MGGDSGSDSSGNDSYVTARGDEEGGFRGTIDGDISLGTNNANASTYTNAMSQFNDDGTLGKYASGNMNSDQNLETISNYNQALEDRDNSRLGGDEFTAVGLFGNQQVSTEEGPDNFVSNNNSTARGGLTDFNDPSFGIGPASLLASALGGGMVARLGATLLDATLGTPDVVNIGRNENGVEVSSPLLDTITQENTIDGEEMNSPALLDLDPNPDGFVDDALNMGKQLVNDVTGLVTGDIEIDDTPVPENLNDSSNDYEPPQQPSVVRQGLIIPTSEEDEDPITQSRLTVNNTSLLSNGFRGFT